MPRKSRMGRPPSDNPRSVRKELRLTADEAKATEAAASDEDKTWSAWVLAAIEAALNKTKKRG